MPYREDLDAAQARVQALEQELARTKEELALVRTGGETALARGNTGGRAAPRWLGGPVELGFSREIDGEVPADAYTELVEAIRRAIGNPGTTTVLPGSLAWASATGANQLAPAVNVYVTVRGGRTTIRAEQKLGGLVGGIYGGVGGGVGGGAIILPVAATVISPLLVPVAVAAWLGGIYGLCRRLYRGRSQRHAVRLEKLVDDLAEIADRAIVRPA